MKQAATTATEYAFRNSSGPISPRAPTVRTAELHRFAISLRCSLRLSEEVNAQGLGNRNLGVFPRLAFRP